MLLICAPLADVHAPDGKPHFTYSVAPIVHEYSMVLASHAVLL